MSKEGFEEIVPENFESLKNTPNESVAEDILDGQENFGNMENSLEVEPSEDGSLAEENPEEVMSIMEDHRSKINTAFERSASKDSTIYKKETLTENEIEVADSLIRAEQFHQREEAPLARDVYRGEKAELLTEIQQNSSPYSREKENRMGFDGNFQRDFDAAITLKKIDQREKRIKNSLVTTGLTASASIAATTLVGPAALIGVPVGAVLGGLVWGGMKGYHTLKERGWRKKAEKLKK